MSILTCRQQCHIVNMSLINMLSTRHGNPDCFSSSCKLFTYTVNKIVYNTPPCFTPLCNTK